MLLLTWLTSLFIFYEVVLLNSETYIFLWSWIITDFALQFDALTAIMLVVVSTISLFVHLYSTEYMGEDPHLPRFLAYLSLFTWFMLVLVTGDNLLQLFLGWEGIGLCSYLLIGFWFTRIQANKASIQAMVVNRIGDVGVVLATGLIYYYYKTFNFSIIVNITESSEIDLIGLLLFLGAVGKSAQIGLHIWLPYAMEGPTPVSSLLHAATLVTAGVYLLIRLHPVLDKSPMVLTVICVLGAITALVAATIGLVQNDLKKVIAYSTCSQLGYMVFSIGLSSANVSIFHLSNHAFFKALLFLSAGSVIHALGDEQDVRKYGAGLLTQPLTYFMILVGSLSLMGVPFLTGFYSKDLILELAYSKFSMNGTFAWWLGSISAGLTAFYSFRLINLSFYSNPSGSKKLFELSHEPHLPMTIPLIFLGFCSIFVGYIFRDIFVGPGSPYLQLNSNTDYLSIDSEWIPTFIKWIPVILSLIGAGIGLVIYPLSGDRVSKGIYTLFSNKWHIDQIYNNYIVKNVLSFSHNISYKIIDRGLIEFIGPTGISNLIKSLSVNSSSIQTGSIYNYGLIIIIGTLAVLLVKKFKALF